MFIATILVALIIGYVKGILLSFDNIINVFYGEPYLTSYVKFAGVGGPPLTITLLFKENPADYGLQRRGLLKNLALSAAWVIIKFIPKILNRSWSSEFTSFNLQFPYNIWYAVFSVFTYRPLDVFFVVWLIVNTDHIFKSLKKRFQLA